MKRPATLFLTGATGFLGREVLPLLSDPEAWTLRLLVRDPSRARETGTAELVTGNLQDPGAFAAALEGVDCLVHMAAATGAASAEVHDRVNRRATEELLAAAQAAGVPRVLFVSSVAAGFADKSFYPYAAAKRAAERAVAASGLAHTILRPTIVLGRGSTVGRSLASLAALPVLPFPQARRPVEVQPVHVRDVARAIATILAEDRFEGETLGLGGRETAPFREFLAMLAEARRGRRPPVVPLPLRLVQLPLAGLERVTRGALPVTAGQFAAFGNSATAEPNWLMERLAPEMPSLAALAAETARRDGSDGPAPPPVAEGPRRAESPETLAAEARLFALYLAGWPADPEVERHYTAALARHGVDLEPVTAGDRVTLGMARRGRLGLWLADGHASRVLRLGLLRQRLAVMTAILEHSPGVHHRYDRAQGGGPVAALARIAALGAGAAAQAAAGVLVLGPMQIRAARARGEKTG